MEFVLLHGKPERTHAMKAGSNRHAQLEEEVSSYGLIFEIISLPLNFFVMLCMIWCGWLHSEGWLDGHNSSYGLATSLVYVHPCYIPFVSCVFNTSINGSAVSLASLICGQYLVKPLWMTLLCFYDVENH